MDETSSVHPLLAAARVDLGVRELVDGELNPRVREYFRYTRFPQHLVGKKTPWCAAALCAWLARAGYRNPRTARAADFASYGEPVDLARVQEGDILVLDPSSPDAGGSGHVTIFAGLVGGPLWDLWGLGANQSNSVCIKAYERSRVAAVRRAVLPMTELA